MKDTAIGRMGFSVSLPIARVRSRNTCRAPGEGAPQRAPTARAATRRGSSGRSRCDPNPRPGCAAGEPQGGGARQTLQRIQQRHCPLEGLRRQPPHDGAHIRVLVRRLEDQEQQRQRGVLGDEQTGGGGGANQRRAVRKPNSEAHQQAHQLCAGQRRGGAAGSLGRGVLGVGGGLGTPLRVRAWRAVSAASVVRMGSCSTVTETAMPNEGPSAYCAQQSTREEAAAPRPLQASCGESAPSRDMQMPMDVT